jgi:hypothetical protein
MVNSFVILLPEMRTSDMQISEAVRSPQMAKAREMHAIILVIIAFIAPKVVIFL